MSGRSKVTISDKTAQEIAGDLREMAKKPKTLSLRELVQQIRDEIQQVLESGYSLEDVCEILERRGISTSPATLRKYLRTSESEKSTSDIAGA